MEGWKDVKGFEGIYRISNCGRFLRFIGGRWKPLSLSGKTKYKRISLSYKGHKVSCRVNRLVYEHFIGVIPQGYEVHHKDGNRHNNHIDNLVALSESEHNRLHREANPDIVKGIVHYQKFVRPRHIIQLTLEGCFVSEYPSIAEASRKTGVNKTSICKVANGLKDGHGNIRIQAGGYLWRLKDETNLYRQQ